MLRARLALATVALLPVLASTPAMTAEQVLIPAGSVWRYNDAGVDLGTAWRAPGFNDATWSVGAAQLGYGDGDEATILYDGGNATNRRITYYFRQTFTVTNPASLEALRLRFVRDDGVIIYLNGTEVARSNMPSGTVNAATLATAAIGGADESAWNEVAVDPARLVAGTNVIAVELHQQSATSTDTSFDLEFRATDAMPPAAVVTLVSPANPGLSNTTAVSFVASAAAPAGLASATLYVGGSPQTVVFTGAAQIDDAQLNASTPTTANGGSTSINVDGQSPHAHGLLKVPALIGSGSGQVPAGAVITTATLQLNCTNSGQVMRLYRLNEDWVESQATWNQRQSGAAWANPGADGAGSNAQVPISGDCTATGLRSVNITRFVQEWSNGAPNYGVVLTDSGTDGIDFSSTESGTSPVLTVVYRSNQVAVATGELSGPEAVVEFGGTFPAGTYTWNVQVMDTLGRASVAASDFTLTIDPSLPDAPVLVAPVEGATDVGLNPTLAAMVHNPAGGSLNATVAIRKATQPEFTVIVMPDTQHYSEASPDIFTAQTQWIVDNKTARNIVFVTHEGDVVEHESVTLEWDRANASMSLLDGVVPYGIGPGNHDQPTTRFNQYFPYTRYQGLPWYGGHMGSLNDNNYQLFSGGGLDFVIVHLTWCPPASAVAWADSVYKAYPNRIGIMTTHGYLNEAAQRTVSGCSNTQYLWDGLAVPNANLHFMLSGHVHDESRRTDTANGHPVFQMLADFQDREPSGGEGWLRILRFVPAEDKVYVHTYSPWLNRFETDANSEFTLDFPMGGNFSTAGTTTVPSDATAAVVASNLDPNTRYEWQMTVTNSSGRSRTGPVWSFTTGVGVPNQPPVANDQSVVTDEDTSVAIALGATDGDGQPLAFTIVSGPAHGSLTGTAPNLSYRPATNYAGADTFTFRVSDGLATSAAATVSIAVQPINDAPTAAGESYSIQAGGTLSISAPGLLANDQDVDGPGLTAQLVTGAAHGVAVLSANGSFTYTPAAGYSGPDTFTYRASDGTAVSGAATASLTVTPPPAPVPVFSANFNSDQNSFTYLDNTFRGTTQSSYADGAWISSGGFTGGALRVYVGGVNNTTINGMSGGWRRTFTLSAAASLTLTLRYNLDQGPDYESDEISQVLASLDGVLVALPPADYIAQVAGNGNGTPSTSTGWRTISIPLGTRAAGTHTLIVGGYNNKKNATAERTTILIDDVVVQ